MHRFGALVTFLYFGLHVASLIGKAWTGPCNGCATRRMGKLQLKRLWGVLFGPDSMMPTWQDWKDFVAHNKWFFGRGPKPQFDRWTYWEKFDYFAVFWGVFIIGASGLIMWFPEFFTRYLPGWIINIALIIHSDEALLAAGFIFSIHFFNTHFRIEKFPMDTVIFSGRVSKTEMLHERKRWYDRLGGGRPARAAPRARRMVAVEKHRALLRLLLLRPRRDAAAPHHLRHGFAPGALIYDLVTAQFRRVSGKATPTVALAVGVLLALAPPGLAAL